jgi:GNAT superfamily N-acetyltransferase
VNQFALRLGRPEDADGLIAFDPVARLDPRRADLIRRRLKNGGCSVAEGDARLFGHVCRGTFFEYDFLKLIYVDEAHRQQGVSGALVGAVERARRTQKLFMSTNESNTAMRAMLARLSYEPSGVIRNLDPGDPELVFVKKFVMPAGLEPTPSTTTTTTIALRWPVL